MVVNRTIESAKICHAAAQPGLEMRAIFVLHLLTNIMQRFLASVVVLGSTTALVIACGGKTGASQFADSLAGKTSPVKAQAAVVPAPANEHNAK